MGCFRNLFKRRNDEDEDTEMILPEEKDLNENEKDPRLNNALMGLNLSQGSNVTTSDEGNKSQLMGMLSDPFKALETNEKLRNAVAAKGKQMGWDLFPTNNELFCDATSTDLGLINLMRRSEYINQMIQ